MVQLPKSETSPAPAPQSLGASARASLLWGGGSILIRDVAQFGVMLILVRLLTPADYGTAAIAQAILGFFAVVSFATFSGHALQLRNPEEVDWQAHFTAATAINCTLAALVLMMAFALSFTQDFHEAALPLAALTVMLIVEIPGTLRHRMLETVHDWKRFRVLLMSGTLLGLGVGLGVGLAGGGVWALIVQPPLFGLPAAIDLLLIQRFRPDWSWSWERWRETFWFGLDRAGAGLAGRGRTLNEQALLAGVFDLATLGIFGRAVGLATLIAGRIGSLAMLTLTPIMTRAEAGSARFRRLADLVLRGVVWTTVPAAAFLGIAAHDVVTVLYGAQWSSVAALLPVAALVVGIGGIVSALSSQLVANNDSRASLWLETAAAVSAILLAVVLIPHGPWIYLAGLSVHAIVVSGAAIALLLRRGALTKNGVITAFIPAIIAVTAGLAAVIAFRELMGMSDVLFVRLAFDAIAFSATYLAILRLAFSRPLTELLAVIPFGPHLSRTLRLRGTH